MKNNYQKRVKLFIIQCFGLKATTDVKERNERFIEEAIELVQSTGMPKEDVLMLVDYVYRRPVGDPPQEVGGVMLTLAGLCEANAMDAESSAETELQRVWEKIDAIRAKQASRPKNSPLPQRDLSKLDDLKTNPTPEFLEWLHELTVAGYDKNIMINADEKHQEVIIFHYLSGDDIETTLRLYAKFKVRWQTLNCPICMSGVACHVHRTHFQIENN